MKDAWTCGPKKVSLIWSGMPISQKESIQYQFSFSQHSPSFKKDCHLYQYVHYKVNEVPQLTVAQKMKNLHGLSYLVGTHTTSSYQ